MVNNLEYNISNPYWLLIMYCISFFLVVSCSFLFVFFMLKKRIPELKNDKALAKETIPESIHPAIIRLAERKFDYIRNYIIFQCGNKICGIASIAFSILSIFSLGLKVSESQIYLLYLIPFSSIICVILALYISPSIRVIQYLNAFRKCDAKINEASSRTIEFERLKNVLLNGTDEEKLEAERIVKEYVVEIQRFLDEIEESLTSDSE